jgi:crotonobetainyl-CoA:carnitine CoA-transferase CaiB-like acyl-CoA transferase
MTPPPFRPLTGITVLDFSRVLAGPMATQILAELGAEVIKVERPRTGDESRQWEPTLPDHPEESAYFFAFNRGKRSITLNLKSPAAQQIARDLAARADVVVENFLPGDMDRMGLGYDALSAANPRLVYVSNTGFGQDGPYRDRKGYDTIFQALSGVMALTGHPDAPPAKVGVPFADLTSGLWIAIAVLAGLAGRRDTGSHIDVAMMDAQVSLLTIAAARLFALGQEPVRTGTEHPGRVPSAAFRCQDGAWLHISGSDQHWSAICATLGLPDLAADPALSRNAGRVAHRARIMQAMTAAIAARDRAPLAEALRAADIPAGEVNSVSDILDDPHTQARGMVGTFDHPTAGPFPALRMPLREAGAGPAPLGTPPLLGAHTDAVLAEKLGFDPAAIAALRAQGAL